MGKELSGELSCPCDRICFKMAENLVLYSSTLKALSALSIYMQSLALITIVGYFRLELWFVQSCLPSPEFISTNRIYDGVEALTRKSQASFQII